MSHGLSWEEERGFFFVEEGGSFGRRKTDFEERLEEENLPLWRESWFHLEGELGSLRGRVRYLCRESWTPLELEEGSF